MRCEVLTSQAVTNISVGSCGSVTFSKSTRYFADRDLGDGSKIDLLALYHWLYHADEPILEVPVVIEWLDWNRFIWRAA